MAARVEYRCWSCRRDVPESGVARFPRGRTSGDGTALCTLCAAARMRRPAGIGISEADADAIRASSIPARELAARYGLTVSQVRRVRSGEIGPQP